MRIFLVFSLIRDDFCFKLLISFTIKWWWNWCYAYEENVKTDKLRKLPPFEKREKIANFFELSLLNTLLLLIDFTNFSWFWQRTILKISCEHDNVWLGHAWKYPWLNCTDNNKLKNKKKRWGKNNNF
jgi:hypothetical protein